MGRSSKARHSCKYCERPTTNASEVCQYCSEKIPLVRQIKAMLMPYYISKKAREEMLGGSDGKPKKGV